MGWHGAYAFFRAKKEVLKMTRKISIVEFKSEERQLLLDITRPEPDNEARLMAMGKRARVY